MGTDTNITKCVFAKGQLASEMVISCCTGVKLDMENKTSYLSLSKCLLKQDEDCFLREEKMKTIISMPLKETSKPVLIYEDLHDGFKRYNGFSNFHKGKKVN